MRTTTIPVCLILALTSCMNDGSEQNVAMTRYEAESSDFDYSAEFDRIEQIKEWYQEASQLEKNPVEVEHAKFDEPTMDGITKQSSKKLTLRYGYEILTSSKEGDEFESNARFYYKNNSLFFAYVSGTNQTGDYQLRYYFSEHGKVIRILEKTENDDGSMSDNRQVRGERFTELSDLVLEQQVNAESMFYGC